VSRVPEGKDIAHTSSGDTTTISHSRMKVGSSHGIFYYKYSQNNEATCFHHGGGGKVD
jgi:hypothetical protein